MKPMFKIWCKNKKEWETDLVAMLPDGGLIHFDKTSKFITLKPWTHIVIFWTGFKDVNGIKAFDKDLIEYDMFYIGDNKKEGGIGIIKWCEGEWIVEKQDGNFICGIWDVMTNYGGTIIGSSYERKDWRKEVATAYKNPTKS